VDKIDELTLRLDELTEKSEKYQREEQKLNRDEQIALRDLAKARKEDGDVRAAESKLYEALVDANKTISESRIEHEIKIIEAKESLEKANKEGYKDKIEKAEKRLKSLARTSRRMDMVEKFPADETIVKKMKEIAKARQKASDLSAAEKGFEEALNKSKTVVKQEHIQKEIDFIDTKTKKAKELDEAKAELVSFNKQLKDKKEFNETDAQKIESAKNKIKGIEKDIKKLERENKKTEFSPEIKAAIKDVADVMVTNEKAANDGKAKTKKEKKSLSKNLLTVRTRLDDLVEKTRKTVSEERIQNETDLVEVEYEVKDAKANVDLKSVEKISKKLDKLEKGKTRFESQEKKVESEGEQEKGEYEDAIREVAQEMYEVTKDAETLMASQEYKNYSKAQSRVIKTRKMAGIKEASQKALKESTKVLDLAQKELRHEIKELLSPNESILKYGEEIKGDIEKARIKMAPPKTAPPKIGGRQIKAVGASSGMPATKNELYRILKGGNEQVEIARQVREDRTKRGVLVNDLFELLKIDPYSKEGKTNLKKVENRLIKKANSLEQVKSDGEPQYDLGINEDVIKKIKDVQQSITKPKKKGGRTGYILKGDNEHGTAFVALGLGKLILEKGTGAGKSLIELKGLHIRHLMDLAKKKNAGESRSLVTVPEDTLLGNFMKEINRLTVDVKKAKGTYDHGVTYLVIYNDGKAVTFDAKGKRTEYSKEEAKSVNKSDYHVTVMSKKTFDSFQHDLKGYIEMFNKPGNIWISDDVHTATSSSGLLKGTSIVYGDITSEAKQAAGKMYVLLKDAVKELDEISQKENITNESQHTYKVDGVETTKTSKFLDQAIENKVVDAMKKKYKGVVKDIVESKLREGLQAKFRGLTGVESGDYYFTVKNADAKNGKKTGYIEQKWTKDGKEMVKVKWEDSGADKAETFEWKLLKKDGYTKDFTLAEKGNTNKDHIYHSSIEAAVRAIEAKAPKWRIIEYLVRPENAPTKNFYTGLKTIGVQNMITLSATPDLFALKAAGFDMKPFDAKSGKGDYIL